ncbi:MAG: hypothetical protein WBM86_20060, partial [Waterburya sp.]
SLIYSINLFLQDKIRVLGDFFRISSVGLPNVGYKWMSHEPIFVTKKGNPSRHQYLGKAGSEAYLKAVEALSRRGRIEALDRALNTLLMGLSDLVEEASRLSQG